MFGQRSRLSLRFARGSIPDHSSHSHLLPFPPFLSSVLGLLASCSDLRCAGSGAARAAGLSWPSGKHPPAARGSAAIGRAPWPRGDPPRPAARWAPPPDPGPAQLLAPPTAGPVPAKPRAAWNTDLWRWWSTLLGIVLSP